MSFPILKIIFESNLIFIKNTIGINDGLKNYTISLKLKYFSLYIYDTYIYDMI